MLLTTAAAMDRATGSRLSRFCGDSAGMSDSSLSISSYGLIDRKGAARFARFAVHLTSGENVIVFCHFYRPADVRLPPWVTPFVNPSILSDAHGVSGVLGINRPRLSATRIHAWNQHGFPAFLSRPSFLFALHFSLQLAGGALKGPQGRHPRFYPQAKPCAGAACYFPLRRGSSLATQGFSP